MTTGVRQLPTRFFTICCSAVKGGAKTSLTLSAERSDPDLDPVRPFSTFSLCCCPNDDRPGDNHSATVMVNFYCCQNCTLDNYVTGLLYLIDRQYFDSSPSDQIASQDYS
jgi:hypothetical protein